MDVIERFSFDQDGIEFSVAVVCYNEFALFGDLYKMTDTHQGGVTVQNPNHHRNSYKFACRNTLKTLGSVNRGSLGLQIERR